MPFDPTLPQTNSQIASAELRNQFNGLKDLIDASPWTANGADIYYNDGKVGIGTSNPSSSLEVNGSASFGGAIVTITADGDLEINDNTKGVILHSPDGSRFRLKVDNAGNLSTENLS